MGSINVTSSLKNNDLHVCFHPLFHGTHNWFNLVWVTAIFDGTHISLLLRVQKHVSDESSAAKEQILKFFFNFIEVYIFLNQNTGQVWFRAGHRFYNYSTTENIWKGTDVVVTLTQRLHTPHCAWFGLNFSSESSGRRGRHSLNWGLYWKYFDKEV